MSGNIFSDLMRKSRDARTKAKTSIDSMLTKEIPFQDKKKYRIEWKEERSIAGDVIITGELWYKQDAKSIVIKSTVNGQLWQGEENAEQTSA